MFDVSLIVCSRVFLGLDSSACRVPEVCSHWWDWILSHCIVSVFKGSCVCAGSVCSVLCQTVVRL